MHFMVIKMKSYYYDAETGLYYLQSRYYDAQVQRFVSPDMPELLGMSGHIHSNNLYSYCNNDPVNNLDIGGYVKINIKWLGRAIDLIIWLVPALLTISRIWKTVSRSANKLVSFGDKLIKAGRKLFKRFDDRLYCAFAKDSTYRIVKTIGVLSGIVTIVSSIGNIVQYIIDILDGKWDGYLDTDHFAPRLDLTKDY